MRLGVHHPDLDRAEVRMRAHVVPEVGVVLDHAGLDHELDPPLVVVPVVVRRRDADAREGAEDRRPRRGQPGRVGAPERRVGRQRRAAPAGGRASRWRRGSPCRGRRGRRARACRRSAPGGRRSAAPRQVAVARARDDPLVLPHRERVRAGRADRQALARPRSRAPGARSARSCAPASAVFAHGSVEISSTDSISSGLISPGGAGSSSVSIALTRSSDSASRIISSSSMPIVYAGPVKLCSIARQRSAYRDAAGRRLRRGDARSTRRRARPMALGYDGKLYILAFDHRGSFQKKMFGIEGDPTPEETETIADAKHLIFEGMARGRRARRRGRRDRRAGRRAVRLATSRSRRTRARPEAGDAGREVRPERVRLPVRRRLRRPHREVRPRLLQGARPLQPRRRRRDERAPARPAQAARRLAARARPQVPVRAARARRPTRSSSRSAATPTATTPSCAPS